MWGRDIPALFLYGDSREESGSVELDIDNQPPPSVLRKGHLFALDRVSRPGLAVYVLRRSGAVARDGPSRLAGQA